MLGCMCLSFSYFERGGGGAAEGILRPILNCPTDFFLYKYALPNKVPSDMSMIVQ